MGHILQLKTRANLSLNCRTVCNIEISWSNNPSKVHEAHWYTVSTAPTGFLAVERLGTYIGKKIPPKNTWGVVLQAEVLIGERVSSVNGVAAGAVQVLEVTALKHELGDDPVEVWALVAESVFTWTNDFTFKRDFFNWPFPAPYCFHLFDTVDRK